MNYPTNAISERLFGTDGIRGRSNEFPLDPTTIALIGGSLARNLAYRIGRVPRVITGRDTRESGEAIERGLHFGLSAADAECESAGVITTPGIAFLTKEFGFDAGIVVSASHNPYQDNGIKIFFPTGKKADDDLERAIESEIADQLKHEIITPNSPDPSSWHTERAEEFQISYLTSIESRFSKLDLGGKKIVVDCANGAASGLAPALFARFGAEVTALHVSPDGRNINRDCGSLHIDNLRKHVIETGADIGIAFDGDADRSLFVDENGELVDGDATLWVLANYLADHGKLVNKTVVATVMSNIGLELALRSRGISMLRVSVGDKFVLDELIRSGSEIGGEQSGHIIFPEISLVGDGMMTAMLLLKAINERGTSASEAVKGFVRYPQILVNVPVRDKQPFDEVEAIMNASNEIEMELEGKGRLLLRYSGTEKLARVMIEGVDQSAIEEQAKRLAAVIAKAIG